MKLLLLGGVNISRCVQSLTIYSSEGFYNSEESMKHMNKHTHTKSWNPLPENL